MVRGTMSHYRTLIEKVAYIKKLMDSCVESIDVQIFLYFFDNLVLWIFKKIEHLLHKS